MRRRYGLVLALTLAAAIALVLLGRAPARAPETTPAAITEPPVPLTIEIRDGSIAPSAESVPKGRHVALRVWNRGAGPARLTLTGYEDRLEIGPIAPGGTAALEFHADRPGEDFAWLLDGTPAGRFAVTGGHLEEGRR